LRLQKFGLLQPGVLADHCKRDAAGASSDNARASLSVSCRAVHAVHRTHASCVDVMGVSIMGQKDSAGASGFDDNTVPVRKLTESAIAQLRASTTKGGGVDPYSTADSGIHKTAPRRTLDDMRRLSERIKRARLYGSDQQRR
jgi:hypothetical protein